MSSLRPIDLFFLEKEEPLKSCLSFIRSYILKNEQLTEEWKYALPFYYLNNKMFCYLWINKKLKQPYIGFVDGSLINHPDLLQENRARMKIFLINPDEDVDVKELDNLFKLAFKVRNGLTNK